MAATPRAFSAHVDDARLAAKRVRDLDPDFKLTEFAASQPNKEQKHLDSTLGHLRSAGLQWQQA